MKRTVEASAVAEDSRGAGRIKGPSAGLLLGCRTSLKLVVLFLLF